MESRDMPITEPRAYPRGAVSGVSLSEGTAVFRSATLISHGLSGNESMNQLVVVRESTFARTLEATVHSFVSRVPL